MDIVRAMIHKNSNGGLTTPKNTSLVIQSFTTRYFDNLNVKYNNINSLTLRLPFLIRPHQFHSGVMCTYIFLKPYYNYRDEGSCRQKRFQ